MCRLVGFIFLVCSALFVNASDIQDISKSAGQGDALAQHNLGILYEHGEGL